MDEIAVDLLAIDDKEELIDEVMKCYGQDILRLAYSYVKNQAIAEDLTQDIFVKCYQSLHTYHKKSAFRTWLWRIAINHCKDYLKSWYSKHVIIGETETREQLSQDGGVEDTVIQLDEDERLANEVMALPIKYREVVHLFYFEEMSIKDMATVISVKENTVKTRLRRAKELLKERLEATEWMND